MAAILNDKNIDINDLLLASLVCHPAFEPFAIDSACLVIGCKTTCTIQNELWVTF